VQHFFHLCNLHQQPFFKSYLQLRSPVTIITIRIESRVLIYSSTNSLMAFIGSEVYLGSTNSKKSHTISSNNATYMEDGIVGVITISFIGHELINMVRKKKIKHPLTNYRSVMYYLPSMGTKHINSDSCHYSPSQLTREYTYNNDSWCNRHKVRPTRR